MMLRITRLNWKMVMAVSLGAMVMACAPAAAPSPTPAPKADAPPAAKPAAASPAAVASPAAAASPSAAASPAAQAAPAVVASAPKPVAKLADFPTKPIEIIIPYPPGGGYDAVARQLAAPLGRELGQSVVIKNVPGGNQRIAARQFEQAPADGHTIMFVGDQNIYLSTFIDPAEGFDITSWLWVSGIRQQLPYIGTGKDSKFKTIADVIAADKAGERIRMGNNGIGGFLPNNALFAEALGLKNVVHVGGFGGTGDLVPALVRGDLDVHVFTPISSTAQFVQSGDIRSLMVLKPSRDALLPDAPTAREAGVPNVEDLEAIGGQIVGFSVVKNTPVERVKVLEQATLNALADPEFLAWAKQTGVDQDIIAIGSEAFSARKVQEYAFVRRNVDVVKRAVQ
ncbi:MAG: Bug family tripartite tricarboxylate transporter substrate binding protein [Chloroflexota bacterium]